MTRDSETAEELRSGGVNAEFCGNPVMDLIEKEKSGINVWDGTDDHRILLLLPGSRPRTYEDVTLILILQRNSQKKEMQFCNGPGPDDRC